MTHQDDLIQWMLGHTEIWGQSAATPPGCRASGCRASGCHVGDPVSCHSVPSTPWNSIKLMRMHLYWHLHMTYAHTYLHLQRYIDTHKYIYIYIHVYVVPPPWTPTCCIFHGICRYFTFFVIHFQNHFEGGTIHIIYTISRMYLWQSTCQPVEKT